MSQYLQNAARASIHYAKKFTPGSTPTGEHEGKPVYTSVYFCAKCKDSAPFVLMVPGGLDFDCPKGGKHQWADSSRTAKPGSNLFTSHFSMPESQAIGEKYWTYRVYLAEVDRFFGDKWQPFNAEYSAAKKIFKDPISGHTIRGMIHSEHAWVFSETMSCDPKVIKNGEELLQMFNHGLKGDRIVMFTYVILADRMHFCETGTDARDMLSKHALLANASREVRYSGEFHVQPRDESGRYRWVLDNNSGTYAPAASDLDKVKRLLEYNFPDIAIEAYNYKDPQLEAYKKAMKNAP